MCILSRTFLALLLLAGSASADSPKIIDGPNSATDLIAGTNITLSVTVGGTPPFSYQWLRWSIWGVDPLPSAETNKTLVLTNIGTSLEPSGYVVKVANSEGEVVSQPALIWAHQIPSVIRQIEISPRRPAAGDPVKISANVVFSPSNQYKWFLNGIPIEQGTNALLSTPGVLMIQRINPEWLGEYSVIVSNPIGAATNSGSLSGLLTNTILREVPFPPIDGVRLAKDSTGNIYALEGMGGAYRGRPRIEKYASDFTLIWSKEIDNLLVDASPQLVNDSVGFFGVYGLQNGLARFTAEGDLSIAPLGTNFPSRIAPAENGVLVSLDSGPNTIFLQKLDVNGITNWTRAIFDSTSQSYGFFAPWIVETSEHNISFASLHRLIMFKSSGEEIWQRNLEENEEINQMQAGPGGAIYLLAMDKTGSVICQKYLSDGKLAWSTLVFSHSNYPYPNGPLAVDSSGSAYMISLPPTFTSYYDAKLTKIGADGVRQWDASLSLVPEASRIMIDQGAPGAQPTVYLLYENALISQAVLAKFSNDGIRRWERIIPGIFSFAFGETSGRSYTDSLFLDEKTIAVAAGGEIAVIEDHEGEKSKALKAKIELVPSGDHVSLKSSVEIPGAEAVQTRWHFLLPHNDTHGGAERWAPELWSAPVFSDTIEIPFSTEAATYGTEIDFADGTLTLPDISVNFFSAFSAARLVGDNVEFEIKTRANLLFRCFASQDLRTWTELQPVQADATGLGMVTLNARTAPLRFLRLVYP